MTVRRFLTCWVIFACVALAGWRQCAWEPEQPWPTPSATEPWAE